MLLTIPQYLSTMSDTYGLTKTLGVIDICRDHNGRQIYHIGNNSIIFKIRHNGCDKMLKCYTRTKHNLRRIYGDKCLREELFIYSDDSHGKWVDVILDDWIEGSTLARAIADNIGNNDTLKTLAEHFDKLAHELLAAEWAHGDLKPENIIVTPDAEMRLIDFDAMYKPQFKGEHSEETGTATFQHPARNKEYFDKSIDDYPIAIISTALHALALDPSLAERYGIEETLLFDPKELAYGKSEPLKEIMQLFAHEGMALQYRIAKLMHSTTPRLFGITELIEYTQREQLAIESDEIPEIDNARGLWGFRCGEQFVIPPIYDAGFDFREGLAAVCVGDCWHYIDLTGRIVLKCPHYEAVKSFRNGEAVVIEKGLRKRINRQGEEI